jgi:Zn-dependent protease with chaperone function
MIIHSALPHRSLRFLRHSAALLVAGWLVATAALAQAPIPAAPAIEPAILQKASNLAFQREISRLQKARRIDAESSFQAYARRLAAPMVAQATKPPYAAYDWSWQIAVETRDDLAFWCLPGGNLVISSAFFERGRFLAAEIAALIAHGYGHALAGHDAAEAAARLAAHPDYASPDPNRRLLVLADILTGIVKRDPYPTAHEREADTIALDLLARSGHDPRGLLMLWKKLPLVGTTPPTGFAAVHPSWPERFAEIEAQLPAATALYEKTKAAQPSPAPRPRRVPR